MKNNFSLKKNGFSLIELMIAILIGLILSAAILQTFISSVRSNTEYLRIINMNQELRAAMNFVTRELKNAGGWVRANDDISITNPYTGNVAVDGVTPVPFNNTNGECITFIYDEDATFTDADANGISDVENKDRAGFKFDSTAGIANRVLKYRKTGDSSANMCTDAWHITSNNWESITDTDNIIITAVDFDLRANRAQDGAPTFYDVIVTMSGATKLRGSNDDYVAADLNDRLNTYQKTITKTVRIRNH